MSSDATSVSSELTVSSERMSSNEAELAVKDWDAAADVAKSDVFELGQEFSGGIVILSAEALQKLKSKLKNGKTRLKKEANLCYGKSSMFLITEVTPSV
mmetsp:Transcript_4470/g.14007  ORF Transcript_4470/g.14007 Transcript_4470/m.14007 type:complete len:99 (+) Transcript_4470:214-510(+)